MPSTGLRNFFVEPPLINENTLSMIIVINGWINDSKAQKRKIREESGGEIKVGEGGGEKGDNNLGLSIPPHSSPAPSNLML